ncbi:acyltransferase family protein [Neobacillus mesonae]|uniref:acyltransferase family protein n=1 Tax=Neobacillus mesonae TaxID=1193713 RepID=UPI00203E3605|nr:acyltransferase family protein [Neobacillus mesonae]MCM3569375.1 acyltransferase family protein [Neobacillus mesonae]
MKKRLVEIDLIRGITIFLVVAAHTDMPSFINEVLKTFRMPLFFIVSGYLFSTSKYLSNFKGLFKLRMQSLLVPYFSACVLSYFVWIGIRSIKNSNEDFIWYKPILGFFYGNGSSLLNQPIWFLVCLFCCQLVFCLVLKHLLKYNIFIQVVAFMLIGVVGFLISKILHLPWGLDIALVSQIFLLVGNKLKEYRVLERMKFFDYYTIILVAIFVISFYINKHVDMNDRDYGNLFFFYLGGFSGSLLIFKLTKLLSRFQLIVKLFSYFGRESLTILIFHAGIGFVIITGINDFLLSFLKFNWVVYIVGGISISLVIGWLIKKFSILNFLFNGKSLNNKRKSKSTNIKSIA